LSGIAIIGMAGRFPGARNVAQFWKNLCNGVDTISRFSVDELEVRNGAEQAKAPNYVRARGIVEDADLFDAGFFGVLPQDARLMDPQHRIFLECCWEAFEDAGHDPAGAAVTGVFAGCSPNSYFQTQVCQDREFAQDFAAAYQVGFYPTMLGAIADTLATRVAYKLNLQGPSVTVLSACSTSLVAIAQACSSLLSYQCDQALAGGVSITFPQKRGYLYETDGMVSPDGRCRTFDATAQGTVFGSGAGVVLLKRLDEAVADGDHIYAVIQGFAVNNDGSDKVGFTAPSVNGQAKVIAMAQALAGVEPRSIGYIEAHGTATPLGDPIEIAALNQVFRASTNDRGFCAIGTAKTNVGHLDVASGVTGLIKTALSLKHGLLPPTLYFEKPNPKLELEQSPFFVNTKLSEWKAADGQPRRAGVSAFGVGGTNAHVVLEEPPARASGPGGRSRELIVLSARSPEALKTAASNLANYLEQNPDLPLSEVAYTLQAGRRPFSYRRAAVVSSVREAVAALGEEESGAVAARQASVHFLFPGQGSQYVNMGRQLYETEPVFRMELDLCAKILQPWLPADLREVLYPADGATEANQRRLEQTIFAQGAIFSVEYALARLWMHWGVQPQSMVGHSVGEFVAACLAGVFSLEDALTLVASRARMMQDLPSGAMLSVRLPETEVAPLLGADLSLAAVNAPSQCVISGSLEAIDALAARLETANLVCRRLATSHAFHSYMMEPLIAPFTERVRQVRLAAPRIPYVSSVTGGWITAEEATDPNYWARHCRQPVRFAAAVAELCGKRENVLLEVGPGTILNTLARQQPSATGQMIVSSLQGACGERPDVEALLEALGRLWVAGVQPDWEAYRQSGSRRRLSLPVYPFERQRYWIESMPPAETQVAPLDTKPMNQLEPSKTLAPQPAQAASRKGRIVTKLLSIFQDLSGMDASEIDPTTTFLELGFDSLFLTQVSQAIQGEFALKITFRQLVERLQTVEAVSTYLDERLPADALPAPVETPAAKDASPREIITQMAATASDGANSASPDMIERIMKDQLQTVSQLVSQQLEFLRNGASRASVVEIPQSQPAAPAAVAREAEPKAYGPFKPIQKNVSEALTGRQQTYLSALIERYTRRTAESKRLTQRYRQRLADPRVVSGFRSQWKELVYPIVTDRSRGSRLWDVDGNEYIDLLNGFGPTAFGHAPDFVVEAVQKQLHEGFEIGPQTALAGRVAELLCELTGMERATFCNTGSEAVMAAMRLARTVTARKKIVLFTGDYHGNFDEVLVKRIGQPGALRCGPLAPGIPSESTQNMIALEYGAPESLELIRAHAQEIAGVLVEPVQSRHPGLQPREFLRQLREITANSGIALIFDEIVTGFRVHPGGAQAVFDIRADLATYGKVMGGGLPIGALAGKAAFMDALDGGMWQYGDDSVPEVGVTFFAGTFVRHPLAMAAANAVLEHLKAAGPALQERLTARTTEFVGRLNRLFEQYRIPSLVESFGSIFYFSFPSDFRFGSLLFYHLREKGVHIQDGFPCFLTTAHSDADLDTVVRAFDQSFREMQIGDALPTPAVAASPVPATIPAVQDVREAPLTEAQLEVWLSAQLNASASCAFNESISLKLSGELDEKALAESLREIVSRHEALRAVIQAEGPGLSFLPRLDLELPLIDYSPLGEEDRGNKLRELIAEDACTPFDLLQGPLVRAKLVRLEPRKHVLVFTAHHIICDGWSTNIIVDELAQLYSARRLNRTAQLPPARPFGDYSRQEHGRIGSQEMSAVESYWLGQFSEPAPALDLPADRPRPSTKSFAGATHRRTIGSELHQKIKRAGARQGSTLFTMLLTGFEALLFRLTSHDDVVVGIPAAGQALDQSTLVGHCVNFLALRAKLRENETFGQLMAECKRTVMDAYEHQEYTYGTLVRKLGLLRDPGRLPLIEAQFNLEKLATRASFHGLDIEVDSNPKSFANFDLFVNIVEKPEGLVIDCDYNTDLFDAATIERWLEHYEILLTAAADDVNQPVWLLPLLSPAGRAEILTEQNRTEAEFPSHRCIHDLIVEQSAKTPAEIAAVFERQTISYADLDRRSNQLARYLAKLGVGPHSLVAICLDRSLDMLIALLGVLKSGAAYVPLDPALPPDRLDFILEDAEPKVVLAHLGARIGVTGRTPVVILDQDWPLISRESGGPFESPAKPDSRAYVIYTSGSTGKPKGVEITHRSVVNFLCSMRKRPGMTSRDRLLAVTTLSFDIAGLEMFLPLTVGARVVIASRESTIDGARLASLIQNAGITVMQATPATWRLMLEAGWAPKRSLKMLCGGEALPRTLANSLLAGEGELWNMYGPTETTIWSAVLQLQPEDGPVRIGPPIDNTQFHVLDTNGQLCPIGVPGELHIGGEGLAAGYFRRPELTAEKFVSNPYSQRSGERLYRTGDLVRRLPNGEFEFLGRLDDQIKLRGFRIELGEIESVLLQITGVRAAAVGVCETETGDKRLVAYLAVAREHMPSPHEAREFLARQLPGYMIPSFYVRQDELPMTANGKLNRRALKAPNFSDLQAARQMVEPRNSAERELADICADVLGLEQISVQDDLFELGADSIRIFQIASRAVSAGLRLRAQHLLRFRTIAAVSAEIESPAEDKPVPGGGTAFTTRIVPVSREKYRRKMAELQ
jgi:amino acid adenylation domain-containing protein